MAIVSLTIALFLIVLGLPQDAFAWGPATHVKLASLAIEHAPVIAPGFASLIQQHKNFFVYGNVIADLVLGKHFGIDYEDHSHNWDVAFGLFDLHNDDMWKAVSLGYLCHLAADVVAHNVFVPTALACSRGGVRGHGYWEMRFDSWAPIRHRTHTKTFRDHIPSEIDHRLMEEITETLLSHKNNKRVMDAFLRVQRSRLYAGISVLSSMNSPFRLGKHVVQQYDQRSFDCISSLLQDFDQSPLRQFDPTGADAIATGRKIRIESRRAKDSPPPANEVREQFYDAIAQIEAGAITLYPEPNAQNS